MMHYEAFSRSPKVVLPALGACWLALAGGASASLLRDNEQGVSPTHSYTRLGAGEVVSNLNGNLVLTIPVADVASASPLGIHLERSYNSHWRDPLVVHQFDLVNKGGKKWRDDPDYDWPDVRWDLEDASFGGIFQRSTYDNPGVGIATGNFAMAAGIAVSTAHAAYSLATVPQAVSKALQSGEHASTGASASLTWASTSFAAAGLVVQAVAIGTHEGDWSRQEIVNTFVGVPLCVAVIVENLTQTTISASATEIIGVVGFALHLYNFYENSQRAEEWDPGYAQNQYLSLFSLQLDFLGTALLFTPATAPTGMVLISISAVIQLTEVFITLSDLKSRRWDIGENRVEPWALSVDGYVGMLGTKLPQDEGTLAWPFSKDVSVHPMPDLFLIRSGGGADRYLLQPFDGGRRTVNGVTEKWYAYKAAGADNRTLVYYCDRLPYQSQSNDDADPADYYLVKEPNGTWARFGVGNTKGIVRQTTKWTDPVTDRKGAFETFWALPNSIHHFAGDSVTIVRDASMKITEVHHSRDPRWVRVTSSPTQDLSEVIREGVALSSQQIDWATFQVPFRRHKPKGESVATNAPCTPPSSRSGTGKVCKYTTVYEQLKISERLPIAVTVPVDDNKSLTTRLTWDDGDLSRVDYPDGGYAQYEWYRDPTSLGTYDGFLHRRVQFASADGSGARVEHLFTHNGWRSNGDPNGGQGISDQGETGILFTDLTRSVSTPSATGGSPTVSSQTSRYRFHVSQGSVNVRHAAMASTEDMPTTPDTALSAYRQIMTTRIQLETALEGIGGGGTRTDYGWDGDRLILKVQRPGIDTACAPVMNVYRYDHRGALISKETNPGSEMNKLEWMTLLSLSGASTSDTGLSKDQLREMLSTRLNRAWVSRFDTLDLTEIHGWRHEDQWELIHDTSYIDRNPLRRDDSTRWSQGVDTLSMLLGKIDTLRLDSLCLSWRKGGDPRGAQCVVHDTVLKLSQLVADLPKKRQDAVERRARLDAADTAFHHMDTTAVVRWSLRNPAFDPYGRYISLPTSQWTTRKNFGASYDSTILGNGIVGSRTVYDSAMLRPIRIDMYQNGWIPGARMEYLDSRWPYVSTGVRTYVDSMGSQLRFRYSRALLDPALGIPVEGRSWKTLFTEPKVDTLGLPGADPAQVATNTSPDFVTHIALDARGRVIRSIGPRGDTNEVAYDRLDRPIRTRTPGGAWTTTTYTDRQDGGGIVWTDRLEESGVHSVSGVNGLGSQVVAGVVSSDGRDSILTRQGTGVHGIEWVRDPEGRRTYFTHDVQGRVIWMTIPKADGSEFRWQTVYNDFERTKTEIDPLGRKTKTTFDLMGNALTIERQVGTSTWRVENRFDNFGNMVWTRSPLGDTTRFEYTLANQLDSSRTAQGLLVRSRYDWVGDPIWSARKGSGSGLLSGALGGDTSIMVYDGLGRLLSANMNRNPRMAQDLIYDAQGSTTDPGMLLGVSRGTGARSAMRYDLRGAMTSRQLLSGLANELSDTLGWEYLADGRPKAQNLPRGARLEFGWDHLGRVGKLGFVDPKGVRHSVIDTLLYRKGGQLDSLRLGSGTTEKYGYDTARGLLVSVAVRDRNGNVLAAKRDSFDDAGRLAMRTRADGQKVYYAYDSLDQLRSVKYGLGNHSGGPNYVYRTNLEGARTSFVHDFGQTDWSVADGASGAANQALASTGSQDGFSSWGWNWRDGLQTRRWQASSNDTTFREQRTYGWNAAEELDRFTRMAHLGDRQDTTRLAQSFGDHGLRTAKYRGRLAGVDTVWTLARRSVWDGSDVIADSTVGDGAWRYRIPFGLNAIAEASRDSSGAWKLTYVISDPVGTPEILLDDTGALVGRYAFGPYGELEDFQGSRQADFLFGGREWDPDLQAGVFGYRLYDPEVGQFLTKDPMDQFYNPYSYCGSDPLTMADPEGLFTDGQGSVNEVAPGVFVGGDIETSSSYPLMSTYTLPTFPAGGLRPDPAKVIDILKPGGLMNLSSEGTKTAVRAGLYLGGPEGIAVNALWHAAEGNGKSAAMDVAFLGAYGLLRTGLALRAGSAAAAPAFSATEVLGNPNGIWGMSAEAIATDFKSAGFQAEVVQSTRGSGLAKIIRVKGHPIITQIQMHPGGGRHAGAYYKISTSTQGIIKVVDPLTYVPTAGEKANIINAH